MEVPKEKVHITSINWNLNKSESFSQILVSNLPTVHLLVELYTLSPNSCQALPFPYSLLFLCHLYDDCLIGPLTDLDMQILHVTSPVGCLGAIVPIRSQICQSLCGLCIRIEVYLYLTSHIDEIVQV